MKQFSVLSHLAHPRPRPFLAQTPQAINYQAVARSGAGTDTPTTAWGHKGFSYLNLKFMDENTGVRVIPNQLAIIEREGSLSDVDLSEGEIAPNGTVAVALLNGTYDISVRSDGYHTMSTHFVLSDQQVNVNFNLVPVRPPVQISSEYVSNLHHGDSIVVLGFVVDDSSGLPLATVTIRNGDMSSSTMSDGSGFFQLLFPLPVDSTGIALRNQIHLEMSGYTSQVWQNFDMWPNGDIIIRIRMVSGEGQETRRLITDREAVVILK